MDESVKISFDKEYKIRVLEAEKFERGEELEKECSNFTEKIATFNDKVNKLVDILESHAKRIDSQKLRVRPTTGSVALSEVQILHFPYTVGYWPSNSHRA